MSAVKPVRAVINFYFDVASPYSYIGFEGLLRYEKYLPARINFYPFLIGAAMVKAGTKLPHCIPARVQYLKNDLPIACRYWGLPIRFPNDLVEVIAVRRSVLAQRFLTAVQLEQPEWLRPAARELARRVWVRDEPIYLEENIREVCAKLNIPDVDGLIKLTASPLVKQAFHERTEEAVVAGAFGGPWMVLREEGQPDRTFFGSDRFSYLCNELGVPFRGPLKDEHVPE